jgi:hypothetical protein
MTAAEIRKICSLGPRKWWHSFGLAGRMQAFCLMEIAAQLAELNERLRPGNLDVNIFDCSFEGGKRAGGPSTMDKRGRGFNSESGQAIAEFAVLLPIFVLVGFGIVDIQWMTRDAQAIEYITTESARCEAIKAPACANESQTAAFALQLAQNVHLPVTKDQISTPACSALTCSVVVNFPFKPLGVWFPSITINRTGQAAVPAGSN